MQFGVVSQEKANNDIICVIGATNKKKHASLKHALMLQIFQIYLSKKKKKDVTASLN